MKTILAPIDFSPVSGRVIREAVDLARPIGARVVVMHSVPPSPIIATDLGPLAGSAFYITEAVEKTALRHLHRIQRDWKRRDRAIDVLCMSGAPVVVIVATAKKLRASHIVIGSHGHTAFYELVAGSTANGVLKRATCPVVVVPPVKKGKARRLKRA